MNVKELLEECVRRGYLDKNGKYVYQTSKEDSLRWNNFLKEKNLTIDQAIALLNLGNDDPKLRKDVLKVFEGYPI